MQITAILGSNRKVERFPNLDGKDLTRVSDIIDTVKHLNAFLHEAASE